MKSKHHPKRASSQEAVDILIQKYQQNRSTADLKSQNTALIKEVERLKNLLDAVVRVDSPRPTNIITPYYSNGVDEATALIVHSDAHIEARIQKSETNGLNEYNPEIAGKRIITNFTNATKIINKVTDVKVSSVIIALLGDIIHGWIHNEYLSTNYMTPVEAVVYAYDVYSQALPVLLNNVKAKNITVVCKVGNHSRTTERIYSSNEVAVSYEYLLYQLLRKKFPDLNWIIEDSYATYLQVYNKTIRFHHGHAIKSKGGVGGIFPAVLGWQNKVNKTKWADLDVFGHWHTSYWLYNDGVLVNGSVCGAGAYSINKGFKAEPPLQQFLLIDKHRGFTLNMPIILTQHK